MRRGDICVIDLDPARGTEANKSRPVVNVDRIYPFQVLLPAASTGLAVDSKLGAAILDHAEAVAGVNSDAGFSSVAAAGEQLLPAALNYADAQFEHTGSGFPFGVLHQFAEDAEDEDEDESESAPTSGITVLQRWDYGVVDEGAVLEAGRKAYLRVWPDDDETAAQADVNHLGRALYQLAHADGWQSLEQVNGLRPTGAAVILLEQEELLGADPNEWPEELFNADGEPLYSQFDVFDL